MRPKTLLALSWLALGACTAPSSPTAVDGGPPDDAAYVTIARCVEPDGTEMPVAICPTGTSMRCADSWQTVCERGLVVCPYNGNGGTVSGPAPCF